MKKLRREYKKRMERKLWGRKIDIDLCIQTACEIVEITVNKHMTDVAFFYFYTLKPYFLDTRSGKTVFFETQRVIPKRNLKYEWAFGSNINLVKEEIKRCLLLLFPDKEERMARIKR